MKPLLNYTLFARHGRSPLPVINSHQGVPSSGSTRPPGIIIREDCQASVLRRNLATDGLVGQGTATFTIGTDIPHFPMATQANSHPLP